MPRTKILAIVIVFALITIAMLVKIQPSNDGSKISNIQVQSLPTPYIINYTLPNRITEEKKRFLKKFEQGQVDLYVNYREVPLIRTPLELIYPNLYPPRRKNSYYRSHEKFRVAIYILEELINPPYLMSPYFGSIRLVDLQTRVEFKVQD